MAVQHFLLGAASGVGATALAVVLLDFTSASPGQRKVDETPRQAAVTAAPAPAAVAPAAVPPPAAPAPRPSAPSPPVGDRTARPATEAGTTATPAPARPAGEIALSAEHAKVLTPATEQRAPTPSELHAQLTAESKDPAWAVDLEQAIRQFLGMNSASTEFEIMSIECRTTMCQVLAFGNSQTSNQRWKLLWEDAKSQPWYAGITGNSDWATGQNDRWVIVTILHRGKRS